MAVFSSPVLVTCPGVEPGTLTRLLSGAHLLSLHLSGDVGPHSVESIHRSDSDAASREAQATGRGDAFKVGAQLNCHAAISNCECESDACRALHDRKSRASLGIAVEWWQAAKAAGDLRKRADSSVGQPPKVLTVEMMAN